MTLVDVIPLENTDDRSFREISDRVAQNRQRPTQLRLEQEYDACIDLLLRRFVYGSLSGMASALVLFRTPTTRWSAVAFGAGIGLGSAYTDCSRILGDNMKWPSMPKWPGR